MPSIFIADLHLQKSYAGGKGYDDHFNALEDVLRKAEAELVTTPVIMGGDIFDTTKVHPSSLQKALEIFNRHPDVPLYFINGNHDPTDDKSTSWMEFCPRAIELGPQKVTLPDGLTVVGMSWRLNASIPDYLKEIDKSADCLIIHQFVEPVFSLEDEFRSIIQNALPSSLFKDFKAVVAGDVHKQQVNSGSIPPLAYPGPPCPCTLKEEPGCFYLSKIQLSGYEPFGDFFIKAVQLPKRPVFNVVFDFLNKENIDEITEQIEATLAQHENELSIEPYGALETNKPWIVLRSPAIDAKALDTISERFKDIGDVLVRQLSERSDADDVDIEACDALPSQSIAEYIVSRLTYENIDDTMRTQLADLILHEQSFIEETQKKLGLE